jgi:hypothetical protein
MLAENYHFLSAAVREWGIEKMASGNKIMNRFIKSVSHYGENGSREKGKQSVM